MRGKYLQAKPCIDDADVQAVVEVLRSEHLEEGEFVRKVEEELSTYFSKKFTTATINGFSSIHLALIAKGVKRGDEVIIPSYTCPALLYPVKLLDAKAVFADIGKNSFNISRKTIEEVMSKKTKAIVLPHMFGFPAKIDELKKYHSLIIEDVAQAMGGSYKGQTLGSFTDICVSSYYATKNLTGGEGGSVSVNDKKTNELVSELKYYGSRTDLQQPQYFNYKMANLNAVLLLSQLKKLGEFVRCRKKIASQYDEQIAAMNVDIQTDFENKNDACYFKYPVLVPNKKIRDAFRQELRTENVFAGLGVLEGLHKIKKAGRYHSMKRTDNFLDRILCLPIYPDLKESDVAIIMDKFKTIGKKYL